ncbi:MAG TPA: hypothetical protein VI479_17685, partial [Blastocatellia bacterium]
MFPYLQFGARILIALVFALSFAPLAPAHPAWGIVVDSQKRIVFTDAGTNAIWRVETDGRLTRLASGVHSHDLWIDAADDTLYGEHVYWIEAEGRWDGYKWRLLRDGTLNRIAEIPEKVKDVIDRQGMALRSEDLRLVARHIDGETKIVGGDPFAGLPHKPDSIRGFTIADDGSVYVADSQYRVVWKVSAGGSPEPFYRSSYLWTPTGVAAEGNSIYVMEGRPDGPRAILSFLAEPRVIRIRGGARPELVMAIDFYRHYVI